jgi:hypothetical protein
MLQNKAILICRRGILKSNYLAVPSSLEQSNVLILSTKLNVATTWKRLKDNAEIAVPESHGNLVAIRFPAGVRNYQK